MFVMMSFMTSYAFKILYIYISIYILHLYVYKPYIHHHYYIYENKYLILTKTIMFNYINLHSLTIYPSIVYIYFGSLAILVTKLIVTIVFFKLDTAY